MSLSHSLIKLTNLELSGDNEAPVSRAALAVWYSSSFMHAVLQLKQQIKIKSSTAWLNKDKELRTSHVKI